MNKKRYLVAVSGGPDSMALLDMVKDKYYIEVGHVNYHKRPTANRDEKIVRDYCKKHSIRFHKTDYKANGSNTNFQASARNFRYEYFNTLCNKHHLDAVLVAHQQDDHLETYLMQVKKNIGVNYYGLSYDSFIKGVLVYRPLLEYSKKELIEYCDLHNIKYGIDESNLTNDYERNRIRHKQVEKLSAKQKEKLLKQIDKKNLTKLKHLVKALEYVNQEDSYTIQEFNKIPYLNEYLRLLFPNKSDKQLDEIVRQINESKSCHYVGEQYIIVKEYEKVNIFLKPFAYEYKFKSIKDLKCKKYEYFRIAKKGDNKVGVSLKANDFPITIRNVRNNDAIKLKYGTKKINRFFIDNKIEYKQRLTWPIVVNKDGVAILVPGIGCNITHFSLNHNLFVIKL